VGAAVGMFAGGPAGAAIGALLGHFYDQQQTSASTAGRKGVDAGSVTETFFRATFLVMGHIAKADGRVSEGDIRAARSMMTDLNLGKPELEFAQQLYREGKSADFPLRSTLSDLAGACEGRADLRRMFVQIQLQTALRADSLGKPARAVLSRICEALDVSTLDALQMEALLRVQRNAPGARAADQLREAHAVLGVGTDATDAEVTQAYRRLMNANHPDKLVAKGLPESMMALAAEKTRQIRAAYDRIRQSRGMR
jgi:DnaJ like chaperone protein